MRADFGLLKRLPSATSATHTRQGTTLASVILVFALISTTNGVPTNGRLHRRLSREAYAEIDTKTQNETQPEAGTCFLDGILVPQTTVYCEKKSGCRAIQKTGYCCPDYKCDCEKDGKIYSNGDKLVDPETPCKVCYCQGGEILCSSVTCYKRDDCEPKFIAGRCCPEYDNCPENSNAASNKTNILTMSVSSSPLDSSLTTSPKPEMPHNPLGIKIKEITKAEEIRIVDSKPKPISPRPKPVDSAVANQLKIHLTKDLHQSVESLSEAEPSVSEIEDRLSTSSTTAATFTSTDSALADNSLQSGTGESSESLKIVRQTADEEKPKLAEEVVIFDDAHGESKPITIFGTQGLTRGDDDKHDSEFSGASSLEAEVIYENTDKNLNYEKTVSDLDPIPSGSDNVYSFVVSTEGPWLSSTSEDSFAAENSTTEGGVLDPNLFFAGSGDADDFYGQDNATSTTEGILSSSDSSNSTAIEDDDNFQESSGSQPAIVNVSHVHPHHSHHHIDDDDSTPIDSNPAYPTIIEEDLSNYPREVEDYSDIWSKSPAGQKDEPRAALSSPSNNQGQMKYAQQHAPSTEGPLSVTNETETSTKGPCLMPFWDRNSTISCHDNQTDLNADWLKSNETSSDEQLSSIELEFGSGLESDSSGMGLKEREPTTPKYRNIDAIDEIDSSSQSPKNDPKDDAESLKYDEEESDSSGAGVDDKTSPISAKAIN